MNALPISQSLQLAAELHGAGKLAEAEREYRKVLAVQPQNAEALHGLGVLAYQAGRVDVAVEWMQSAVHIDPDTGAYWTNLTEALRVLGRLDDAIEAGRHAVALAPDNPDAHNNLGIALLNAGHLEEAADRFRRALAIRADFASALNNLGNAMKLLGLPEAEECYRRVLAVSPDHDDATSNLGVVLQEQHRLDEAAELYRRLLARNPRHGEACNNLAVTLLRQGKIKEGIDTHRKAMALNPKSAMYHSNLLLGLHYDPEMTSEMLFHEHRHWAERHAEPLLWNARPSFSNDRTEDRVLRVGYVSPRFRDSGEARFLQSLLSCHDRQQFRIYGYSDSRQVDSITQRVRGSVDEWRDTAELSDSALAQTIRDDRIDVLVDLMVHGTQNRLLAFARKPSPVQITYLAYPGTTGMTAMDCRFTDACLDPETADDRWYSEKSVRLETYWCYPGIEDAPDIVEPPSLKTGQITFGSLNRYQKVSDVVVDYWISILRRTPKSRLMLHADEGKHRERVERRFQSSGIPINRLLWVPRVSWKDYLQFHQNVDIALDPHPYAGGTTTCDALWMGVPVVTLSGRTAVSRSGVSLLTHAGLPELITASPDEYVKTAVDLAMNPERLHEIRSGLRPQLKGSVLMDRDRYARSVEGAYRNLWRRWCRSI